MYKIKNFTDNDDIKIINQLGPFTVVEYTRDLSVMPGDAMIAYYCNEMNVRKRQVICDVAKSNITLQAGAMQWTVGDVNATTGVKGVGDLFGDLFAHLVVGQLLRLPLQSVDLVHRLLQLLDLRFVGGL